MNKWILYKTIQGCRGFKILINTLLIRSEKENYKLVEIAKKNFQAQWISQEETLLFSTDDKHIIFTDGEQETLVLSTDNKAVCVKIPVVLSFNDYSYSSKIFAGTTRKGICIYNFHENNYCENETEFSVKLVIDDKLLCLSNNKDILTLTNDSFSMIWSFAISQFGSFMQKSIFANGKPEEKQREINRVYFHNNKIIVTLSRAIIALDPESGQLLWKIDFAEYNPMDVVFHGQTGYIGEGLDYAVIDIEKGVKIFEKIFDRTEQVVIEGNKLTHILYIGLAYHEGYIWFTHGRSGKQFLFKAKPENGEIVDGLLLETQSSSGPPLFDENRMYILDQDGVLYIYENQDK